MKNITIVDGKAWRVHIERRGIRYSVHIPFADDQAAALQRALAERERFYAALGATAPRSNTGVSGISELTHWAHNRATPCFAVSCGTIRKNRIVRFFYRRAAQRPSALRSAIAHRARLAGENPAQLLAQAKEALCL